MNWLRLSLSAAYLLAGTVHADSPAKVIGITDGDTIKVLDASKTQHRIRLAGIDAPERKQPLGTRSKQGLSDTLAGKEVTIEDSKERPLGVDYRRGVGSAADCPTCPRTLDAGMSQLTRGSCVALQEIRP